MKPIVCNKNPIVSIPFGAKDCEYWLVTTTDLHSVDKPSRDNAYLLPNGDFYVYNGNKFVHVNDHSNLKVKWGNVIGDINNQKDLQTLFQEVNKKIDTNKNNIAQNNKKITSLETRADNLEKKDQDLQTQIDGIDYVKSISRNGTLLNKDQERNVDISVPENVSDLSNDLGYITPEYLDRNNYVKNITRNGAFLPNNDGTVDIQVPDKLSQIHDDIGLANSPNWTFLEAVTVDFNKNDKTFLTKKAPMCTELLVEYYVNDRMVETETIQIDGSKPGTRTLRKGLMFSTDDGTKYPIDTSIDFGVISVVTRYEVAVSVDNKLTNTEAITSLVNKLEMKFYYRKRESADSLAEYSTLKKQVKTNTDDVTQLKQDLLSLENATLEKHITKYIAEKGLQQNTPIFNNVETVKVDIKKDTEYTIETVDSDGIINGRGINLYEKHKDGAVVGIGKTTGNGSVKFVAKSDVVSINIFVEAKNITKNGTVKFIVSIEKANPYSIESVAKSKVDSGYRIRKGNIFERGSVTGSSNIDATRARSIPFLGAGMISVKNVAKNGYLLCIRVWKDRPYGTMEYDSGWQALEDLIEYDVAGKYYSIGICHPDYTSTVDLKILNSLGIKIYEKLLVNNTDEIIEDIHKRLDFVETVIPMFTSSTVKNIAHRGDDIIAPQNTAPAYIEARKRGFTVGENDVTITKDGVYVTWHDVNLSRISVGGFLKDINGYDVYTDGDIFYYKNGDTLYTYTNEYVLSNVDLSTLTQCKGSDYSVETLNYDVLSRIDFGVYMGAKFKGTKILTFEEWILLCKQLGMEVYIDKKFAYTDERIEYMYNIVKKHGMLDKASWLDPLFDKLRSLDANARMCTLTHPTTSNIAQFQKYNNGRGFFFNGNGKQLTKESVQLGLNAGFEVEVWYVDYGVTPEKDILNTIRNAVNYGCTGISTDHYTVDDAFRYLFN